MIYSLIVSEKDYVDIYNKLKKTNKGNTIYLEPKYGFTYYIDERTFIKVFPNNKHTYKIRCYRVDQVLIQEGLMLTEEQIDTLRIKALNMSTPCLYVNLDNLIGELCNMGAKTKVLENKEIEKNEEKECQHIFTRLLRERLVDNEVLDEVVCYKCGLKGDIRF